MKITNYSKETQKQIKAVLEYLKNRYGKVSEEWLISIELLADNLDMYRLIMDKIKEQGIVNEGGFKNQLLATAKDYQASIMKIQQKLGISPYDTSKIKVIESDSADLLSTILGENNDDE